MAAKNYDYFIQEFKKISKIDLSKYKDDQMARRLEDFMRRKGIKDFIELGQAIKTNKELVEQLKEHMTINVTEFLRNEKLWEDFYKLAVPEVLKNKKRLKIWSSACSSGEEPYTIAILMKEHFPNINVEIIASDIDEVILGKAKEGLYKKSDIRSFDEKTLNRYFQEVDLNTLKIKEEIKKNIKFEKNNLLDCAYPMYADIIVCRNVLIYFKDDTKNEIYKRFSDSLNDNGILFIGATEQIFKPEQFQFKLLKSFFYQKRKEG